MKYLLVIFKPGKTNNDVFIYVLFLLVSQRLVKKYNLQKGILFEIYGKLPVGKCLKRLVNCLLKSFESFSCLIALLLLASRNYHLLFDLRCGANGFCENIK